MGTGMHSVCILNLHQYHHRPSSANYSYMRAKQERVSKQIEKIESSSDKLRVETLCPLALKAFPGFALAIPEYFMILHFECPVSEIRMPSEKRNYNL